MNTAPTRQSPRTIREHFLNKLFQSGLFEDEAEQIMDRFIADEANKAMKGRWSEPVDAYPPLLIGLIWTAIKSETLAWINVHKPGAWYRSLFV